MKGATLTAALNRIERKAEIMRLDAKRHSTARQDAEEIKALAEIAQRQVQRLQELYEASKAETVEIKNAPIRFLLDHGKGE